MHRLMIWCMYATGAGAECKCFSALKIYVKFLKEKKREDIGDMDLSSDLLHRKPLSKPLNKADKGGPIRIENVSSAEHATD